MNSLIFEWVGHWLRGLAGQVASSLGVGGIAANIAGSVLLLALMSKLAKWVRNPVVVVAALAVLSIGLSGWWGGRTAPETPRIEPVAETPAAAKPEPGV